MISILNIKNSTEIVQSVYHSISGSSIFTLLAICDLFFLLIVSKNLEFGFKWNTEVILLSHGTIFIIIHLLYYINVLSIVILLLFVMILVLLIYILREGFIDKVVGVGNSIFLCGIVEKSIVGVKILSPRYAIGIMASTIILVVILGMTQYPLLLKIHTILNCYIVSAYIISSFTGIEMLSGSYDFTTYGLSFFIGLWLLFGLVFVEFVV